MLRMPACPALRQPRPTQAFTREKDEVRLPLPPLALPGAVAPLWRPRRPDLGRPSHKPDEASRRQVEALAGYGVREDEIGEFIGIDPARAETTITPSSSATLSTINPAGIRDDSRMLPAMVLIPPQKQHHAATQNHQM